MESKEEKCIIIEFQKKILQEAGCGKEAISFLDEIEDEVFCEYYCFCFLDGMSIEDVRRIDSIPVQNWKDKIKCIKEERIKYLERLSASDTEMQKKISELHEKAGRVFKETEELRNTLNTTLQQTLHIQKEALMEQKESYQNSLNIKEELLKEKDRKIQSLLAELEQSKGIWEQEEKSFLVQLEEKKEAEQNEKIEMQDRKDKKKKYFHFFHRDKEKEPFDDSDTFIEDFLSGDTYNDAQKEFLIGCLEQGDSVEEIKTYASENLSPVMMQRLRQVRKKRRGNNDKGRTDRR